MKSIKSIISISLASALIIGASGTIFADPGDFYVEQTKKAYSAKNLKNKEFDWDQKINRIWWIPY